MNTQSTDISLLAVETSGLSGSVALVAPGNPVQERSLVTAGRRHAQTLALEVDRLLTDAGLTASQIDVVAVSVGPGSFTGLRVGVVFAKTFAWANAAKLVAVDTLQAIAYQVGSDAGTVISVSDAQRNELFVNQYEWNSEQQYPKPRGAVRIEAVDAVAKADRAANHLIAGPGLKKYAEHFKETSGIAPEDRWQPHAASIAAIGRQQFQKGDISDPYRLEPVYLRRSYAEEKRVAAKIDS